MPGIVTQFRILELTNQRLKASSSPALREIGRIMEANSAFAHLGAIGPALADFIPTRFPERDPRLEPQAKDYADIWMEILGVVGGPGALLEVIRDVRTLIAELRPVVEGKDKAALCELHDNGMEGRLSAAVDGFKKIVGILQVKVPDLAKAITVTLRPKVNTATATTPVPEAKDWTVRDYLHWKRPGQFVQNLLRRAEASGDDRLRAYAFGYVCSFSGNVCGSSFVNSIVGGPPRTQWWRRHIVNNFIDAWVYGAYETGATMAGDTPTPPYAAWPNLDGTNVQTKITFGPMDLDGLLLSLRMGTPPFPQVLPVGLVDLWFGAFEQTYGPGAAAGRFVPEHVNRAYVMTWLMLWFRTSGFATWADGPLIPPAGWEPPDLNPFHTGPDGKPIPPPPLPEINDDPDWVCGIIAAILGGLALLGGLPPLAEIAFDTLDCEGLAPDPDWAALDQTLFSYRLYLQNGLEGLRQLLVYAGLGYPIASSLHEDKLVMDLQGHQGQFESGKNMTRSRSRERFPSKAWAPDSNPLVALDSFNARPTAANPGFETPPTLAYFGEHYPSFFVSDDVANPLSNGDVKTRPLPGGLVRMTPNGELPVQFGNAVANAIDLFMNLDGLPDWNLDADRGMSYSTWRFNGFYNPDAVDIKPEGQ